MAHLLNLDCDIGDVCLKYEILTRHLTRKKPKKPSTQNINMHIAKHYGIHPLVPDIGRPTNVHVDIVDNDSRTPHSDPTAHNRSLLEGTHRYGILPKGRACPSASNVESLLSRSSTTIFFPITMHSSSRFDRG